MDGMRAFLENFDAFTHMLGGRDGIMFRRDSGSFAASTGLPYAGENYAMFSRRAVSADVRDILEFFRQKDLPFVAPLFSEVSDNVRGVFDSRGLTKRKTYTAMLLERPEKMAGLDGSVIKADGVDEWADAAWEGFGGETPRPAEYLDFAEYLRNRKENSLFILKEDGKAACCALLLQSENACGLYYFATIPAFRRRGLAKKLLSGLLPYAFAERDTLVLLATEEGLPFYRNFGFKELKKIPIFSTTNDI